MASDGRNRQDATPDGKRRTSILDEQTCRMICPIAAAMVGVCLTGISLLRVVNVVKQTNTLADDLLALDAVLFLVATFSSYFALRVSTEERLHRLERFADSAFILAMTLLTATCVYITYALNV